MGNKPTPLVSVVVPSYNHEQYIELCIKSIMSQTYENIELIVIDDGSTDNSKHVIAKLAEQYSFFYEINENQGLCSTLNRGLELAKGEYFAEVASDDFWHENKIQLQVNYLEKTVSANACCGMVNIVDNNNVLQESSEGKVSIIKRRSFGDLFMGDDLPPATIMYRTNVLMGLGGFDPAYEVEDLYIWLKLTVNGSYIDTLPDVVASYRFHSSNSHSRESWLNREHHKIIDLFKEHELFLHAKIEWSLRSFNVLARRNKRESLRYLSQSLKKPTDIRLLKGLFKLVFSWS